jgi:hypothetical protein
MKNHNENPKDTRNKEKGYVSVTSGRKRYKLFVNDIKKIFRLQRRIIISIPVFQEKIASIDFTDADIEDNVEFES